MPYTMEDFQREYRAARFNELTLKEMRKILEKQTLTAQQRLEGLTFQERLEGLSPKEIEDLERYLQRRKRESESPKPKKKN